MLATVYLLSNGSASSESWAWPGGEGIFMAEFTGGEVKLQYQGPNPSTSVWLDVGTNTTLTASGGGVFMLPPETPIRAAVSGATAVYATVMVDERGV